MQPADIFQQIALDVDLTALLPLETTPSREHYYYIKAYKLVNPQRFINYCKLHKKPGTKTEFHLMLWRILGENYPPLEYNHDEPDGYPELSAYVALARQYLV